MATVESEVAEQTQEEAPAEVAAETTAAAEDSGYTKREWEHYEQIRQLEREVRCKEGEYEDLKEEANAAKKAFEKADKELRDLIARGPDPQMKLPLDKPKADEAWRTVPLSDVKGITEKQLEKLAEGGLNTIGDVTDFTQASGKDLSDIDGIGPQTAAKIADALADWWKDHPEFCGNKPNRVPARIKLTKDFPRYDNDDDGLYQHVEVDVTRLDASGDLICYVVTSLAGREAYLTTDDCVVIEWKDAE